jgi:N-acetylglucosaminyl-diphospho-decaprenol L-rhamnosyltransferase
MNPVTAIIVTYQSARTLGRALAGARRCHDAGLLDLVVVDNASRDATREILAREAGWARVVLESANHGFGRGCNIGFGHVKSAYTLLLNPDAVIEPPALRTMLEFMDERPDAGIVGPATLCGSDEQLQPTGPYPTPWSTVREALPLLRRRSSAVAIVPGAAPLRTGWVCGAVLMIRSALMRELRGFDPRFFLYWEEIDLCRRAEQAGYENWVLGAGARRASAARWRSTTTRAATTTWRSITAGWRRRRPKSVNLLSWPSIRCAAAVWRACSPGSRRRS